MTLRFMTFNIRFDTIRDEPDDRWADRVKSVIETIRVCDPDVIGVQEAIRTQLADLTTALPGYRALGRPRDVGDTAEYVPLFVRSARIEVEEHGDFWLSTTPEVEGSVGWDATVPRHCTWARARDRSTEERFAVFNTHLDRWGALARVEAARLIVAEVRVAPELPVVVMGDFNADEDSEPLDALRAAGLVDTFRVAHPDEKDVQTIHHYVVLAGRSKIDYVMCDARWNVLGASIVREPAAGRLPSDHYPVVADLAPVV